VFPEELAEVLDFPRLDTRRLLYQDMFSSLHRSASHLIVSRGRSTDKHPCHTRIAKTFLKARIRTHASRIIAIWNFDAEIVLGNLSEVSRENFRISAAYSQFHFTEVLLFTQDREVSGTNRADPNNY
jgi:hypothetical protein